MKKVMILMAAIIFAAGGCTTLCQEKCGKIGNENQLKIGWASTDISTDEPVLLSGQMYIRISQGVLDPITATALWIDNGKDSVCFVSLDMISGGKGILDGVSALLKERNPEIPLNKIIIGATHTHAAPEITEATTAVSIDKHNCDPLKVPTSIKFTENSKYRKFLFEKLAGIISEAYKNRKAGGIAYGYGDAQIGYNRRAVYKDDFSKRKGVANDSMHGIHGHAVLYGNTDDDMFASLEGAADPTVNFLFTFDQNRKLTGAIINSSCPSQNTSNKNHISADYWHDIRKMIRAEYGNIYILPQCGAAGDVAPWQILNNKAKHRRNMLKYGRTKQMYMNELQRIQAAEKMFAAFNEVYPWAKNEIITAAEIRHEVKNLELPVRDLTEADYNDAVSGLKKLENVPFVKEGNNPAAALLTNSLLVTSRRRYVNIINRWNMQQKNEPFKTQIHVLCIGDIAFASNIFELYQDYQVRIQGRSPFMQTFIIQLASHEGSHTGGYLATKRSVDNKGYGSDRFSNTVDWKGGEIIVEETVKTLKKFWNERYSDTFPARKTAGITLDGALDEEEWKKAAEVNSFIAATGYKPTAVTTAKVMYDDKFVYVGIKASTAHIKGQYTYRENIKYHDGPVWKDDSCEVMLGKYSTGDDPVYNHYVINTAGVLYDGQAGGGKGYSSKLDSEIKYRIKKYPGYYTMEMMIPASDFGQETFAANDVFKINMLRSCHNLEVETSTIDGAKPHSYKNFRLLKFAGDK